jgi:hypothetical protein
VNLSRHPRLSLLAFLFFTLPAFAASTDISVQGPGHQPNLGFACCDQGIAQLQSLVANQPVLDSLKKLHAQIAVPIQDFSAERAAAIRSLNQQGIPVVAGLTLSPEDGYYMNDSNEPQAEQRVAAFEQWTRRQNLQWSAVGLDIEPNFGALSNLRKHPLRLIATLLGRALNAGPNRRAAQAYSALIHGLQSRGYVVQTYQLPYVPIERGANSSLIDRQLGTVDVHGNTDYLMLYSVYARPHSSGAVWSLGRGAQAIAIGTTVGPGAPGAAGSPLSWDEFSRDLIVAAHYTDQIGVYNLEGCIRQGYLPRLETFNWSQTITLPSAAIRHTERLRRVILVALWLASHILYFILGFSILAVWFIRRRAARRNTFASSRTPQAQS